MFAACAPTPKSYNVEGVAPNGEYNNQLVYMFVPENDKPVDSALIVNDKFSFTGSANVAVVRQLVLAQLYVDFILENGKISVDMADPKSAKGTPLNNQLSKMWNVPDDKFDSLYAQADDIVRNFEPIQKIAQINERRKQTAEGKRFTDFTIENGKLDGSNASLSDYVGKGKYVLVDFWASWCAPCIAEKPVLTEVYNKHKGDNFELLGVAVWDKPEDTKKAIEEHNIPWAQILNSGNIATDLYGINMIPHIILFAPDGTIFARGLRGERLKAVIEDVMCDCH